MGNLFQELKRRKVFRVAAIYAVISWVLIQVADTVALMMNLPESTPRFIFIFCNTFLTYNRTLMRVF